MRQNFELFKDIEFKEYEIYVFIWLNVNYSINLFLA